MHQIIVILDNIRSALNVGSIFRTSDGAGIEKLYLTGITPYPPHNKIPKTALGAVESVEWEYNKNIKSVIEEVSKRMPIVAVELTPDAVSYTKFEYPEPVAIVMGNEISGVSEEILNKCQMKVKIPMYGSKESLNVATAYGIIIYEIVRQYNAKSNIGEN